MGPVYVTCLAYSSFMTKRLERPVIPFLVAAAVWLIATIAVIQLPDSYAARLERQTPLDSSQSGWAYRLLAFAAIVQAFYGGFVLLKVDKVRKAKASDPAIAATPNQDLLRTIGRTAGTMILLTLLYAVAAFYVTGQRGGYWLFLVLAAAQAAWYFRQIGQIAGWMEFSPQVEQKRRPSAPWRREPPDYTPPLAR